MTSRVLTEDLTVWAKQTLAVYRLLQESSELPDETLAVVAALIVVADRVDAVAAYSR